MGKWSGPVVLPFSPILRLYDHPKLIEIHLMFMYLISLILIYHLSWPRGYSRWNTTYASWSWVQFHFEAIFERNFFFLNIVHGAQN